MTEGNYMSMNLGIRVRNLIAGSAIFFFASLLQAKSPANELTNPGGLGIGFNNTGAAFQDNISAIQINPALLVDKRQYIVSGNYHWPASGNEFFQAGVIDSQTSSVAAAMSYMGYLDDEDSAVKKRINLGIAQAMGPLAAGISGQFLDASTSEDKELRSIALNIGVLATLGHGFKIGGSVENFANEKIKEFAPRTYRVGASYALSQKFIANLDYQNRELLKEEIDAISKRDKEEMVVASLVGYWRNYLKLFASYGRELRAPVVHEALSGGAGIENQNFALYYMIALPDMAVKSEKHHAVNLSFNLKM